AEVAGHAFDAVFYPGGHGPLWDLADDTISQHLIEHAYAAGKPVGAVCHGLAALRDARGPFGLPLVRGKHVTGFSDSEEAAVGLADDVPFSVEQMLKEHGGLYSSNPDFEPHVVTDGGLVTGQNPASSTEAANALLRLLS
ncbi:MAG TPA: type 1 glutamine amidotransferase domain-containing protein, partial [Dokdonella sp.]